MSLLTSLTRPNPSNVAAAFAAGEYVLSDRFNAPGGYGATAVTLTADRLYVQPIYLNGCQYDRIGVNVGASAAGKSVRLSIYARNPTNTQEVGQLLVDGGGALSVASTGWVEHAIVWSPPRPGWYLAVIHSDGTPSLAGWTSANTPAIWTWHLLAGRTSILVKDGTAFGPAPNPFPSSPTVVTNLGIRVGLRVA